MFKTNRFITKHFLDATKLATENIPPCCFSATQGLIYAIFSPFEHQLKNNNHIFSYQARLYTSLHIANQAP